jgi:hypothetical protein
VRGTFAFLLVVCFGLAATADAEVHLTIRDGRVTLDARNVTVAEILAEWARVGRTHIVNGETVAGGLIKIERTDVLGNSDGGAVRADVAVFVDNTFNFTVHPPRSLTVEANGFTPYGISFAIALPPGIHNFPLRGQNYAGATPSVFGQTSPGLLTVTVVKQ